MAPLPLLPKGLGVMPFHEMPDTNDESLIFPLLPAPCHLLPICINLKVKRYKGREPDYSIPFSDKS
jgi:hypothetical protein